MYSESDISQQLHKSSIHSNSFENYFQKKTDWSLNNNKNVGVVVGNVAHPDARIVRIVHISDTRGCHTDYLSRIPNGHIFIHSGDFNNFCLKKKFSREKEREKQLLKMNHFFGQLPHPYKIFVPGNEDFALDGISPHEIQSRLTNAIYLHDKSCSVLGLNIHGSPWSLSKRHLLSNATGPNGFSRSRKFLQDSWSKIPDNTDVLVTHTPPWETSLYSEVITRIKPTVHLFGDECSWPGIRWEKQVLFSNGAMFGRLSPHTDIFLDDEDLVGFAAGYYTSWTQLKKKNVKKMSYIENGGKNQCKHSGVSQIDDSDQNFLSIDKPSNQNMFSTMANYIKQAGSQFLSWQESHNDRAPPRYVNAWSQCSCRSHRPQPPQPIVIDVYVIPKNETDLNNDYFTLPVYTPPSTPLPCNSSGYTKKSFISVTSSCASSPPDKYGRLETVIDNKSPDLFQMSPECRLCSSSCSADSCSCFSSSYSNSACNSYLLSNSSSMSDPSFKINRIRNQFPNNHQLVQKKLRSQSCSDIDLNKIPKHNHYPPARKPNSRQSEENLALSTNSYADSPVKTCTKLVLESISSQLKFNSNFKSVCSNVLKTVS